jgi:pyruvate dehydrogenase E2 component (dihydrolipoamide acetyltransferase)
VKEVPVEILLPALSPTMEKANVARWLRREGDPVRAGDIILEVETDKATMEIEAEAEGVLARILVPAGSNDVPVNERLALLTAHGEVLADLEARGGRAESPSPAQTGSATPSVAGNRVFATPIARRLAREAGLQIETIVGSGPHGRVLEADIRRAIKAREAAGQEVSAARAPWAEPGPERTSSDALMLATPQTPASGLSSSDTAGGATADQVRALFEPGSFEEMPLDGMRKTIAKRLLESKQTIPHFYLTIDVELDALLALREQLNGAAPKDKDGKPAYKLSVNDFVIKALALALQRVPNANAVWAEDRILKFKHSDVGVAVAIEGGLFTPVIRKAEQKSLSTISTEMKDLAGRARSRKLKPEEYQGGTTAVSNLGMFGIKEFAAVINPPHATILAVGAGEARVVAKNGAPAVVQAMSATLSVDHRVVDGALGAELLAAFKTLIEQPMVLLI